MDFSLSHIKQRYRESMADRSISIHATLAEMLGTGIVVLVGTSAVQFSQDALDLTKCISVVNVNVNKMCDCGHMPGSQDILWFSTTVSVLSLHLLNAVVFGTIYFAVTCATRHHGGAHLNPAITLASFFAGVTPLLQAVLLIAAQILGAIIASAIVLGLVFEDDRDHNPLGANTYQHRPGMTRTRAFGVEIIGTFVVAYVFLQSFAHPRGEHKVMAPLAVGLAYTALLTATAPYSSASLNPARTLGPAAVAGESDSLWIWIVGPIIGALIAVPMHLVSVTDLPEVDKDGHVQRPRAIGDGSTKPEAGKAVPV